MGSIGRNQPCPCGSGLKYKRCHGHLDGAPPPLNVKALFERQDAEEQVRRTQQGLGKPIISARIGEHQMVGVGNTVFFSKDWKTFPDFLTHYIKVKLGSEWGEAEKAKPLADRHTIMQWFEAHGQLLNGLRRGEPGELISYEVTGLVACFLGLAYGLYLLEHNVELQARFINRLKDPKQFQGAYYELMVASTLIRAGFTLTLEDESDGETKHCEFAAVSSATGKRFWVEAKMRTVPGLFGRQEPAGRRIGNPLSRLVPHLNAAFKKPAADERLIFIDLNTDPSVTPDGQPAWFASAVQRIERYEREELPAGETAYLFVTNMAYHRQLDVVPVIAGAPFGLGMPDFNRPGMIRVVDAYRQKRKHIDADNILDALSKYAVFPASFDGRLPSEAFGKRSSRVLIGETYLFEGAGSAGEDLLAVVNNVAVNEEGKEMTILATDVRTGGALLIAQDMSAEEVVEYRQFRDGYFGKRKGSNHAKDEFELFEWLVEVNRRTPRQNMLKWLGPAHAHTANLSDEELLLYYAELMVAAVQKKAS